MTYFLEVVVEIGAGCLTLGDFVILIFSEVHEASQYLLELLEVVRRAAILQR